MTGSRSQLHGFPAFNMGFVPNDAIICIRAGAGYHSYRHWDLDKVGIFRDVVDPLAS